MMGSNTVVNDSQTPLMNGASPISVVDRYPGDSRDDPVHRMIPSTSACSVLPDPFPPKIPIVPQVNDESSQLQDWLVRNNIMRFLTIYFL